MVKKINQNDLQILNTNITKIKINTDTMINMKTRNIRDNR